jgi:diguanylate cyclase (GGDEF)-like protein
METTKHPDKLLVLSPHPETDVLIKSLDLKKSCEITSMTGKRTKVVCAVLVKASWANKNIKTINKLFVDHPDALLILLLDKPVTEKSFGFTCLPVSLSKTKKVSKESVDVVKSLLNQWGSKTAVDRVKKEIDLDAFSKSFLNLLIDKFGARNTFLLIAEVEPGAKGFASLGNDLFFRADKPCDFETTLKQLDLCKQADSRFCLYNFEGEGLRGYKVWFALEFDKPTKVANGDFESALAPIRSHIGNVITLHEAQSNNMIDDLTSLYNQRYLITVLDREISRSKRQKAAFSVLFLDVDFFKLVNDTKGHWVGSRILSELGGVLKNLVRNSDYCFRYGGDEFVVILVGTDQNQAGLTAERIRRQIEQTEFQVEGIKLRITVSIGVAVFPNHAQNAKEIVKIADQAMYVSKRIRNTTHVTGT